MLPNCYLELLYCVLLILVVYKTSNLVLPRDFFYPSDVRLIVNRSFKLALSFQFAIMAYAILRLQIKLHKFLSSKKFFQRNLNSQIEISEVPTLFSALRLPLQKKKKVMSKI